MNTFAVRAVVYNDHRGGYINNVPSTFTRKDSDLGIHYANYATACDDNSAPSQGACVTGSPSAYGPPPGAAAINNHAIAKNAINPVTYQGIRASALWAGQRRVERATDTIVSGHACRGRLLPDAEQFGRRATAEDNRSRCLTIHSM